MADVTVLKTYADCDAALASLRKEKATYAHRDYNQSYAETQASDRATTLAAQHAKALDDVTRYTTDVARTDLTKQELTTARRNLIAATARRDSLALSMEAVSGAEAYLADVDADQVDAQLSTLDAAIAAVTAHRATLSA
ncbi:hypothetical protein FY528_08910 [Hymenobacter lutimineralis]|uniref:Uncharacterized protein n=1 Tax=Hymenobacter lutimineralis TaxID=2606448 RepID=A0A5D6V5W8_9BACT|nr:hypothetical protein [Hymenobacter lutimineralis]TYZ10575.1 hypothetical protein FY528_08910 [Hymenobacter lutimineralis]